MPYFWYNFGGIFVNIVTVIIEVIILAFNIHPIVNIVLLIFLYITLLMLFSNGIPYKDSFNDARNIVSIKKSKRNLKACYDQLEVAYHLINTPIEELQIDDYLNDDLSVGMVAGNNIFNFYKALASKDAEGAFHIISTLYNKIDQIITPMQALVYSEYLTMVLLYERDLTKVTKIFNEMKKPIRNAILLVKDSPFLRGAIIYYRFVKHDEKRIPKLYDAAYLTIKKSNQKGLNDTLLMLLDEVINYQEGEINE